MKGITISQTGPPSVLQYSTSLPIPISKENEVLIKNTHIGLNYIDMYLSPFPLPCPLILS
jgi:NADPH:quinone reductase-like Zn-dependent oxidoreductase